MNSVNIASSIDLKFVSQDIPQSEWIDICLSEKIKPLLQCKTGAYGSVSNEFYTVDALARRNFPSEYEQNPWYAMVKVVNLLVDKHNVALSANTQVYESEERMIDCIIYAFLRYRLAVLGKQYELEKQQGACTNEQCTN